MESELMVEASEIVERIGQPVRVVKGGFGCPVCEYEAPFTRTIGVHLEKHWREAGYARLLHTDNQVTCPEGGCRGTYRRGGLGTHLHTQHGVDLLVAQGIARVLGFAEYIAKTTQTKKKAKKAEGRNLPAVVEEVKPELADPTDAALAVVLSQVNGHGVPSHLLGDVVQYVDVTRELARRLREGMS